ncbi:MAG: cytochrome C oxidase subunit IV family protein [Burkholderiales bacterium]|nr:cytochrome C oxidase subunit IV family protein [Burkholderiales bacterium]
MSASSSPVSPGRARWRDTAHLAWLALFLATGLTLWLGERAPGRLGAGTASAVLALAVFKGWLVADEFMGLRGAPRLWRWLVRGWLLAVCGFIATLRLLS